MSKDDEVRNEPPQVSEQPQERELGIDVDLLEQWFVAALEQEAKDLAALPKAYKVGEGIEEVLGD